MCGLTSKFQGLVFSIIIVRSCSDTSVGSTTRPHTQTLSLRFQSAPRANRTGLTEDSLTSGVVAEVGLPGRDSALPHEMTEKEKNTVGFKLPLEARSSEYDLPAWISDINNDDRFMYTYVLRFLLSPCLYSQFILVSPIPAYTHGIRASIVTPQVCGNPRLPSYSLMGHNSGAF